jgi:lipid-binding SYLF domain-containing protein
MGVDKFRVVFLFDNERAFNSFVDSGWEFGGQSTVAAKAGDKGGLMAVSSGGGGRSVDVSVDGQGFVL